MLMQMHGNFLSWTVAFIGTLEAQVQGFRELRENNEHHFVRI